MSFEGCVTPPAIRDVHPDEIGWLEALHAQCFNSIQRWSGELFAKMLLQKTVTGLVLIVGAPIGFLLVRRVGDENEILTIAIDPQHQRQGHAEQLMRAYVKEQQEKGPALIFLEVAIDNIAAVQLYKKLGFTIIHTRKDYYEGAEEKAGMKTDGYVMARQVV
jgi:ribosomal-protein-alanine N-acetyltransferase